MLFKNIQNYFKYLAGIVGPLHSSNIKISYTNTNNTDLSNVCLEPVLDYIYKQGIPKRLSLLKFGFCDPQRCAFNFNHLLLNIESRTILKDRLLSELFNNQYGRVIYYIEYLDESIISFSHNDSVIVGGTYIDINSDENIGYYQLGYCFKYNVNITVLDYDDNPVAQYDSLKLDKLFYDKLFKLQFSNMLGKVTYIENDNANASLILKYNYYAGMVFIESLLEDYI